MAASVGSSVRPVAVGSVASKHGVSGLTKAAALEYATRGIRVNAVAPGMVRTPLAQQMVESLPPGAEQAILSVVPQNRWCESGEIAEVVVFLCYDAASHVAGPRPRHADRRRMDSTLVARAPLESKRDMNRSLTRHAAVGARGPSAPRLMPQVRRHRNLMRRLTLLLFTAIFMGCQFSENRYLARQVTLQELVGTWRATQFAVKSLR